jgi:thiamine biosynthesis lipoprotein
MTAGATLAPPADLRFAAMGTHVRLVSTAPDAGPLLHEARDWLLQAADRLSRFVPGSELCALNEDPRPTVAASPLLRAAVRAMLQAAERSGGLVDPTLLAELEAAGYRTSRRDAAPLPLAQALAAAPTRRAARPHPDARFRTVRVDDRAGTITRPPGLALDTGGTGKGLLADLLAQRLWPLDRVTVDCGGDVRVAGRATRDAPQEVQVLAPLTGAVAARLWLGDGAIATSGVDRRIWRTADGGVAHHLLDPSTGRPAWTGLIGATAIARTALEAETLAKTALLSGPDAGRTVLGAGSGGGVLFHDDGRAEGIGPLAELLP